MSKIFSVYILANKRNGTLYTGVTGDLVYRVQQHKNAKINGFTKEYGVKTLVYYELFENPEHAILREKQIKAWKRAWKLRVIEKINPQWKDLYEDIKEENNQTGFQPSLE